MNNDPFVSTGSMTTKEAAGQESDSESDTEGKNKTKKQAAPAKKKCEPHVNKEFC